MQGENRMNLWDYSLVDDVQYTYSKKLTKIQRAIQRKKAQELHKRLNRSGVKVQLKGANNDNNQSTIQLPNGLWLLVTMEPDLCYYISEDREGNCELYYYEDDEQLIKEIQLF